MNEHYYTSPLPSRNAGFARPQNFRESRVVADWRICLEQGMVTQWQSLLYEDRFAHTHQKNPDFVKLGNSMGVKAQKCVALHDLEAKLRWLIEESDGPALLEVVVDRKVSVLPMVEASSALHEMRVYDPGQ